MDDILQHHPGKAVQVMMNNNNNNYATIGYGPTRSTRRTMGRGFWDHLEHLETGGSSKHLLQVPPDPFMPDARTAFDLLYNGNRCASVVNGGGGGAKHHFGSMINLDDERFYDEDDLVMAKKKKKAATPVFVRKLSKIFSSGSSSSSSDADSVNRRLSMKENLIPRIHSKHSLAMMSTNDVRASSQPPPTIRVQKSRSNNDLQGLFMSRNASSHQMLKSLNNSSDSMMRSSSSLMNLRANILDHEMVPVTSVSSSSSPLSVPKFQRSISRRKILDSLFEEPESASSSFNNSHAYLEEPDDCQGGIFMRSLPEVHRRIRRSGRSLLMSRSSLVTSLLAGDEERDSLSNEVEENSPGLCQDVISDSEEDMFKKTEGKEEGQAVKKDICDDHRENDDDAGKEEEKKQEPFMIVIFDMDSEGIKNIRDFLVFSLSLVLNNLTSHLQKQEIIL